MKSKFKIGDIVGLKSGGTLAMTVIKVNVKNITTVWSNKSITGIGEKTFPEDCLETTAKQEVNTDQVEIKQITGMVIT